MAIKQDWLLREIENLVQFVSRFMFNKDFTNYEINDLINNSESDVLFKEILRLLEKNKICEAENLIFKNIKEENLEYLKLAIDFYTRINEFSDEQLSMCNFSRDEIVEGLKEILEIYGVPSIGLLN